MNQNFLVARDSWKIHFRYHMSDYIDEDYYNDKAYQKGFNDDYKAALIYAQRMVNKQRNAKTKTALNK